MNKGDFERYNEVCTTISTKHAEYKESVKDLEEEFDLYEYRTVWLHLHPPTELGRFEQFRLASVAFGGCTACGRACDARQPL